MVLESKLKKFCLCGCGEFLPVHWYNNRPQVFRFIRGHSRRGVNGFNPSIYNPRQCLCGCGMITSKHGSRFNFFIKGHENIGRSAWNKGKTFSLLSRYKMSLARRGKEPANKAKIDIGVLYKLYVEERKNIRLVSNELNVSYDSVKNRLQTLRWSRSTKESCASLYFRERMRRIRIRTLTSRPALESPNKLERLVYETLDDRGVMYQKQVPLFDKFVVDLLFPEKNLVVEIFGRYWHELPINIKKDYSKKRYLLRCGYNVEEIWDYDIKKLGAGKALESVLNRYNLWLE